VGRGEGSVALRHGCIVTELKRGMRHVSKSIAVNLWRRLDEVINLMSSPVRRDVVLSYYEGE
jgi:hypothetical protein